MEKNKKAKRSRRRLATQILCLFLCVLMVGGIFMSVLPIGDSHEGHDHTESDSNGSLTLDDILNSIETENGSNQTTTPSINDKTE